MEVECPKCEHSFNWKPSKKPKTAPIGDNKTQPSKRPDKSELPTKRITEDSHFVKSLDDYLGANLSFENTWTTVKPKLRHAPDLTLYYGGPKVSQKLTKVTAPVEPKNHNVPTHDLHLSSSDSDEEENEKLRGAAVSVDFVKKDF
eukprot:m.261177 g.261177  ORF g.261177 m.261177 type:complete len:145 (-) comp41489_c0_seq1:216-650(-)